MIEDLKDALGAIRAKRVVKGGGEVEERHRRGENRRANDGGRAVSDGTEHEDRNGNQGGEKSCAVADAVGNFLPE